MSMGSEIEAKMIAIELEKVLLKSVNKDKSIFEFCKKHVYPIYQRCTSEAWTTGSPELYKAFDMEKYEMLQKKGTPKFSKIYQEVMKNVMKKPHKVKKLS